MARRSRTSSLYLGRITHTQLDHAADITPLPADELAWIDAVSLDPDKPADDRYGIVGWNVARKLLVELHRVRGDWVTVNDIPPGLHAGKVVAR